MSFLFVALDSPDAAQVKEWVEKLDRLDGDFGYKVNLDFITRNGAHAISLLRTHRPIFADMKMWNSARTMADTCTALYESGAAFTNVYLLAGVPTLRHLVEILQIRVVKIRLLGLTVLTHYNDYYCNYQFSRSLMQEVAHLAKDVEMLHGLSGIIAPGVAVKMLQNLGWQVLVPAARPIGAIEKRDDQLQTTNIESAVREGATWLVCGSPIIKSDNPEEALKGILEEIKQAKRMNNA